MIWTILLFIVGLAMVVYGSDLLVDGASAIARKARISEFVIGLTIVGFGTSCPELVVSLTGAFNGVSDISIGNVIGSNIFNTVLILGITAMLTPIAITSENKRRDIPILIGITVFFILVTLKGSLNRVDAVIFLLLFAGYMVMSFKTDSGASEEGSDQEIKLPIAILMTVGGLAGLIFGGQLFVDKAVVIAKALGVSEKFIAVTLLAGGTSLPELVTCVVAAAKKKGQLALGNIIGSNIFNILLILGCSALVRPLSTVGMNWMDMGVLMASALLLFVAAFTGKKNMIDRFDAAVMLLIEAAYLVFLFINA